MIAAPDSNKDLDTNAAAINAELVKDVLSYYFEADSYTDTKSTGELIQ